MVGSDKAAVWGERLRRYERAGLTVAEFCQREGVSVPSFYQWRRRLAEASPVAGSTRSPRRPGSDAPAAFQQVLLAGAGVVAIELPSGVRVELPADRLPLVRAVVADLLEAETSRPVGAV
jgi:transposase-like protein